MIQLPCLDYIGCWNRMGCDESHQGTVDFWSEFKSYELREVHCPDCCINGNKNIVEEQNVHPIYNKAIKFAEVCAIIEIV